MYTTSILDNLTRLQNQNKSLIYLYRLLQLDVQDPINTYFGFKNYETEYGLVAIYNITQSYVKTVITTLPSNKYYVSHYIDNDGYVYVFFELFDISTAYDTIKTGNYSKLDKEFKNLLSSYKDPLINYGLFPENYFESFAEEFDYPVECIPKYNGNELIPPPNLDSEYIRVPKEVLNQLETEFELV